MDATFLIVLATLVLVATGLVVYGVIQYRKVKSRCDFLYGSSTNQRWESTTTTTTTTTTYRFRDQDEAE